MNRKFNSITKANVQKYTSNIITELESIIDNYLKIENLYSSEEIDKIITALNLFKNAQIIINQTDNVNDLEELINKLFSVEESLKEISFKAWDYEKENGCKFISWLKDNKYDKNKKLIFSTFDNNYDNTFCGSDLGIEYKVNANGFIGANNRDGATLIQDENTESIYTIGKIDGKCINSYNMSTMIVSPKTVMNSSENNYQSKHNEIILDNNFVTPSSIICLNKSLEKEAEELSSILNIPVLYQYERQTR